MARPRTQNANREELEKRAREYAQVLRQFKGYAEIAKRLWHKDGLRHRKMYLKVFRLFHLCIATDSEFAELCFKHADDLIKERLTIMSKISV